MDNITNLWNSYQPNSSIAIAVIATTLVVSVPLAFRFFGKSKKQITNKNTIILCGFEKKTDSPSSSAYCQKVETFLRATSTPHEHFATFPTSAPKGKLPYIIDGDKVIPDSHFIIQHLIKTNKSRNLNASLTRVQQSDSRAFQAYFEELVYPAIVWERWGNDTNIKILQQELFSEAPWLVRKLLTWYFRRNIRNALWMQGIGRHSREELEQILTRAVDDLEARLDENSLTFHGTQDLTEIDVIAYSFLVNALGTESNPFFNGLVLERSKMVQFTRKVTQKLFPEYKNILIKLDTVSAN